MGDDFGYLEKFRLTDEHKDAVRKAFLELVEGQLDALEGQYMELFRKLPRDVAERMTPQEAAGYVDMVIREAASVITAGASALHREAAGVMKDEEKMARIRKSFLDGLGFRGSSG